MKRKKLIQTAAGLLAALTLLSACGGASSGGTQSASGEAGASTAASGKSEASPDKAVTLRMIESLTSPERTAVLREIADKYQAAHPNVTIEIISPPLEGADQKISQMMQAKQPLDVVEVREQTVQQFLNNGWIADMSAYVKDWPEYATLTEAAKGALVAYGDGTYMVPYGFYQRVLFYRKDWFAEAGLQPPTTWQELYDAGVKLTDPTKNRYGWAFRGAAGGYFYADMLNWAYLGTDKLADAQLGYFTKDGKTIFSTPEVKEATALHKKFYTDMAPKDAIAWGYSEMVQSFLGGTTAMLIQDPEVIATVSGEMAEDQWGVMTMPKGPSGQAVFPNGLAGWGITSYTENADVAADFVLFLSNAENNTSFAKKYSTIPIHSTAVEMDKYFSEGPFSIYMQMAAEPDVYRFAQSPNKYQAFGEYHNTVDQWYQQYLTDVIDEDQLLKNIDEYWTAAIEKEGKLWE